MAEDNVLHVPDVGTVAGCERTWPDRLLLDAVARIAGAHAVQVMDEVLGGESGSAFVVAAGDEQLVAKLVPGGRNALGNQRRLIRLVSGLRRRGYPAPEYVGAGESGGTVFTVQRRLPGQGLHRPGLPPDPELFAAVLPDLLAAIALQRDAGDLARPPWPTWLTDTIEAGGDGYCLHAPPSRRRQPRSWMTRPVRMRDDTHVCGAELVLTWAQ
jgi:hypothetical protein